MDYCGPAGIPWTTFHSWDQASRDAALLWQKLRNETCSSCGTHPDDWDPETGGHIYAWVATTQTCKGCKAVEVKQQSLTDGQEKSKAGPGVRVGLKLQVPRRHV